MSAIDLLESQHREVEKLFQKIEKASKGEEKMRLFEEIADKLAIHAAIEEHHFYPAVKEKRTEDILLESVEEHLVIKRTIADLLKLDVGDVQFDPKNQGPQRGSPAPRRRGGERPLPEGEEDHVGG